MPVDQQLMKEMLCMLAADQADLSTIVETIKAVQKLFTTSPHYIRQRRATWKSRRYHSNDKFRQKVNLQSQISREQAQGKQEDPLREFLLRHGLER